MIKRRGRSPHKVTAISSRAQLSFNITPLRIQSALCGLLFAVRLVTPKL